MKNLMNYKDSAWWQNTECWTEVLRPLRLQSYSRSTDDPSLRAALPPGKFPISFCSLPTGVTPQNGTAKASDTSAPLKWPELETPSSPSLLMVQRQKSELSPVWRQTQGTRRGMNERSPCEECTVPWEPVAMDHIPNCLEIANPY